MAVITYETHKCNVDIMKKSFMLMEVVEIVTTVF